MNKWSMKKLEEVAEFTNGGAWNQDEYVESGIPVVRVSDIEGSTINLSDCKFLPLESLAKYRKHILCEGDLIIATVGSHPTQPASVVGKAAVVPAYVQGALLNQNAVRIAPLNDNLDKIYLQCLGKSQLFRDYIIKRARGSANQVRISIGALREMDILLPPPLTQRKIASILSAYDDLIENNTRRIKILEDMAQALYREWFVKFRFPGHEKVRMVESELGMVPEGWEVKNLFEAAEVTYGFPFKSKLFTEESIGKPVIRIRDIKTQKSKTFTPEQPDSKYILKNGDLLVGMDGDFHMGKWAGGDAYLNQRIVRFRPRNGISAYYLFLALKSPIEFFDETVVGTTVAHLSDEDLKSIYVALPDATISTKIMMIFDALFKEELNLEIKNANLRRTRDLLLPKLISGEVDVEKIDVRIPDNGGT